MANVVVMSYETHTSKIIVKRKTREANYFYKQSSFNLTESESVYFIILPHNYNYIFTADLI